MSEVKWIKISTGVFDNRKIKQLEQLPDGDTIIVIWFKLLCLAGICNDNGIVYFTPDIPYTDQMLATQFNRPVTTVQLALKMFQDFGMIEIVDNFLHISSWEKYQNVEGMEKIREQNRIRQKNWYDKQKALPEPNVRPNVSLTQPNATDIDKEKDIDKDLEVESKKRMSVDSKFDLFWKEYPRKVGKEAARKAFAKVKVPVETLMDAIAKQKVSDQWKRGYIPNPATWLNQGRWEDDLSTMTDTKKASLGIATVDQRHATHGFTPTEF